MPPEQDEFRTERLIGVGCVTTVGGFFAGGMIAVLLAKIVGWFRGCVPETGLPACDWHIFMLVGAISGLILLPSVVFHRLRSRK